MVTNADSKIMQDAASVDIGESIGNFALGWLESKDKLKGGKNQKSMVWKLK